MSTKKSSREKLLELVDQGFFTYESLLNEIVVGMSEHEAREMFDHITQMHDINNETEEE